METFVNETWFGKSLNADDDNFLMCWMVTHRIKTYFQSHPDAEVLTTLEESSKFLKQYLQKLTFIPGGIHGALMQCFSQSYRN
ncbi:hypothetical protein BDBG_16192 [Blastomyces gilchristii SLH14081]|uniref:Uncharacterized protein n=1 Tax=Blastomyces gilchristii (strain SLH14081) TaxID=559298 RepID=A0A179U811_BLAGS|nr:uncharacterized protein BDBG_16192 [Blastomyces gilchristii SLH14081]OAT04135.1 hypothetical protein BDBG_16192 [Blastomyces gilchristii SLH14081]